VDDTATVTEDDPATAIPVLTNDIGAAGTPISGVTQPANGTVLITGGGSGLTYAPDPDFCNDGVPTDDFTYTLSPSGSVGTVRVTVTCVNDPPTAAAGPYAVRSNIQINTPIASGLLALSFDHPSEGSAVSVSPASVGTFATTASGSVTVAADGSFTYDPPPGYVGPDDFSFTVTDSGSPLPAQTSAAATVTLNVAGPVVWFIDASAAGGGDGTLATPFNCISGAGCFDALAADDPGDSIFVAAGSYSSSLTLLANQLLLGEGASSSLAAMVSGLTPLPANSLTPLPPTGGIDPSITSGGTAVTLGSGNTVRGLTIGNTGGAALGASSAGTLTVTELTVNGTGAGVDLSGNTGTLNFTGAVSLSTGTSTAFSVTSGGTLNVTTTNGPNDVTTTTGTAVEISSTTIGGSGVTFESVDSTGAGANTAIILADTGAGLFTVTGVGTTSGSGGTISNKTVDAVTLSNTDGRVTLANMVVEDIGVASDTTDVNGTRSGVDGIHGQTVDGGLTLDGVILRRFSDNAVNGALFSDGISATVWTGLEIRDSTIEDANRYHVTSPAPGKGDSSDEGLVRIVGIKGTVVVENSTLQRGAELIDFFSDTSGTLDMTVQGSDFIDSVKEFVCSGGTVNTGRAGIDVTFVGAGGGVVRIGDPAETNAALGNTFTNNATASVRIGHDGPASTGDVDVVISQNTFEITDHLTGPAGCPAGTFTFNFPQGGVLLRPFGPSTFEAIVSNNLFDQAMNADGGQGQLTLISDTNSASEFIVRDNEFKLPWNGPIEIRADGNASMLVKFGGLGDTNTYTDGMVGGATDDVGFATPSPFLPYLVNVRNGGSLDLTIDDEILSQHDDVSSGFASSFDASISGGTLDLGITGSASPDGYRLTRTGGTFNLFATAGCGGGPTPQAILDANGNTGGLNSDFTDPPTVVTSGTITCSASAPMLPAITIP
jgi:hypothetical protein